MQQFAIDEVGDGLERLGLTPRTEMISLVLHRGIGNALPRLDQADQWLLVLSGRGVATINGRDVPLKPGTLLLIEPGELRELRCNGDRPLLAVLFRAPAGDGLKLEESL